MAKMKDNDQTMIIYTFMFNSLEIFQHIKVKYKYLIPRK